MILFVAGATIAPVSSIVTKESCAVLPPVPSYLVIALSVEVPGPLKDPPPPPPAPHARPPAPSETMVCPLLPETPPTCRSPVRFGPSKVLFDRVCAPVRLAIVLVSTEIVVPLLPSKFVSPLLLARPAPIVNATARVLSSFAHSTPVPVDLTT